MPLSDARDHLLQMRGSEFDPAASTRSWKWRRLPPAKTHRRRQLSTMRTEKSQCRTVYSAPTNRRDLEEFTGRRSQGDIRKMKWAANREPGNGNYALGPVR